ncbi:MAG: LysE family translocator [Phyllobacteriaceae bacterium]|nr:LysE family translocator [Phyllobacteriaceae bacterium]
MSSSVADQLIALLIFSVVGAFTPGPNNVMLLASGVNFGFRRTLPHMAGVALGHPLLAGFVALGLGETFRALPWLRTAIEAAGVVYLLWLAARIAFQPVARGIDPGPGARRAKPFGFFQAMGFQWVNAKGWVVVISAVSVYVPEGFGSLAGAALLMTVFFVVAVFSTAAWTALGAGIARWLRDPLRLRLFNVTMALALVASLEPAFVDLLAAWRG